jgi:hypothetical protein
MYFTEGTESGSLKITVRGDCSFDTGQISLVGFEVIFLRLQTYSSKFK